MPLLSLQEQSLLSIACHAPSYPASTLALIPPRLRVVIALNLCPIDLHRIEDCPDFLRGLGTVDSEYLWKRRYETTLSKFSNVAGLDLDLDALCSTPSLSLFSKDRYLMACLLNIPHTYSESHHSPYGVALFGITDLSISNGRYIKRPVNTMIQGLKCLQSRGQNKESFNFVSGHYLERLKKPPYNYKVGSAEWSLDERIHLFAQVFPNWTPPYIPIQYDTTVSTEESSKGVIVYSKWYESRHYAEINESDERPVKLNDSFNSFFKSHSLIDTVVLLAPAVQKGGERVGSHNEDDDTITSLAAIQPLSITAIDITRVIIASLPVLKHLSIAMHWADTSSLDTLSQALPSLYHSLVTLHLRIVRPKFEFCNYTSLGQGLCELYRNSSSFEELILQGILFNFKGFNNMMLAFLNTPPTNKQNHHTLILRTVKILELTKQEEVEISEVEQVMPKKCHYTKSLHLHRVLSGDPFCKVFSAFKEIYFNKLSFSTLQTTTGSLFPSTLKFRIRDLHFNNIVLNDDSFRSLQPALFGEVERVELLLEGAYPLNLFKRCFEMCKDNLTKLQFNSLPGVIKSQSELEYVFTALFSLPSTTLSKLDLNVTQLTTNLSSQLATGNRISLPGFVVQNVVGNLTNRIDLNYLMTTWKTIYKSWEVSAEERTKIYSLQVPGVVLDELYDQLSEMATELIEDTL